MAVASLIAQQLPLVPSVTYPDALPQPVAQQPDAFSSPILDRTSPLEDVGAPEYFARPPTQQPDAGFEPIIPPAAPFFGAYYPDSVPAPLRAQQPDALASPIRDRTSPLAEAYGPERVVRPAPQQPDSFVIALRERTATFFDAQGPPRLDAPKPQQPASLVEPLRERTSPFAEAYYPERLWRHGAQQPPSAIEAPRIPDPPTPVPAPPAWLFNTGGGSSGISTRMRRPRPFAGATLGGAKKPPGPGETRKKQYQKTHPAVQEAKRRVRLWMDEETFARVPDDLWGLFANPKVNSSLAYAAAQAFAEHVAEIRDLFKDVSQGPEEERIWKLVAERWAGVWSSFVKRIATTDALRENVDIAEARKLLEAPVAAVTPSVAPPTAIPAGGADLPAAAPAQLAPKSDSPLLWWVAIGVGLSLLVSFLTLALLMRRLPAQTSSRPKRVGPGKTPKKRAKKKRARAKPKPKKKRKK